jgi:hypothetical protein
VDARPEQVNPVQGSYELVKWTPSVGPLGPVS